MKGKIEIVTKTTLNQNAYKIASSNMYFAQFN